MGARQNRVEPDTQVSADTSPYPAAGAIQAEGPLWERTGPRTSPAEAGPLHPKGQSDP